MTDGPVVPDTVTERAARGLFDHDCGESGYVIPFGSEVESEKEHYREAAKAALVASGVLEENRRLRAAIEHVAMFLEDMNDVNARSEARILRAALALEET